MKITDKQFDQERALYNLKNSTVINCLFDGPADGESALKECRDIQVVDSKLMLRYPVWHCHRFELTNCLLGEGCRAPLWYSTDGMLKNCKILGVKPLRECENIVVDSCDFTSTEVGWNCRNLTMRNCQVESQYFLMGSRDVTLSNVSMKGKYSFQYLSNVEICDSVLDTKDAFWHTHNVTVKNCKVIGEYLGWYSDGLTFINCDIYGTQPLCYCKNLTLINCAMHDCDLSFEYSDVDADIVGEITSVKNPTSGKIVADGYGETILEDSIMPLECKIITR